MPNRLNISFLSIRREWFIIPSIPLLFLLFVQIEPLQSQESSIYSGANQHFAGFLFNPAITGSKDFSLLNLISSLSGRSTSQLISYDTRLKTKHTGYFDAPAYKSFSHFGIGGYVLHTDDNIENLDFGISSDYHLALNKASTSFLSIGIAMRNRYNMNEKSFEPDASIGLYAYSGVINAGVSVINLLASALPNDSLGIAEFPIQRTIFFQLSNKIVISRPAEFIVEPSIILQLQDFTATNLTRNLQFELRLFLQQAGFGVFAGGSKEYGVYLQYNFPRVFIGTFLEVPKEVPFYKTKNGPLVKVALGLNINGLSSSHWQSNHW